MNSKECLERIIFEAKLDKPIFSVYYQELIEARGKLEKDLDVLEMLKKKMSIETDYYDSDDGCEEFEYIVYNGEALNIDTQEEFNKIKEWLENED